jgi:uncharacterized membrane protein
MLSEASQQALRRLLWFGLVLYALVMAVSFWVWAQLPTDAQVPTHYGLDFVPDRYDHKDIPLLWMPQLVWVITAVMYFIPRFEPRRLNLERSMKAYVRVTAAILIFLSLMVLMTAYNALSHTTLNASFFALLLGLLFTFVGNYLGKVRSTFFFGIRTPWTLSSDLAWQKTHRLAGKLFVIFGLEMVLGGLLFNHPLVLFIGVGGIALSALYSVVYSYFVWKADPNKKTL